VNDIFLTIGFSVNSLPISEADPVKTLKTPGGKPASSANTAKSQCRERCLACCFNNYRTTHS
jgi:hypothetical protein